ncbi:MAG: hypothetical protein J7604_25830 [Sporocytophaga sp.]|uniref:HTH domain-containing protein n=1 Tax=Sporocytophaga sp. TaxID=2231183 RepID=UPI001B1BA67B|nr:HTH domain-containing protein [Sporocytophaga sp.]MBO9703651.1 hypothetical protein [Sporocytophaga sp.]
MTFLELAEKVLKESQKPLTVNDIWETASKSDYLKYLSSEGKTPKATLGALLHVSAKDNENSPFGSVGSRPKKFILKSLNYSKEDLIEQDAEALEEEGINESSYLEKDLHAVLTYYIYTRMECYSKTLNHQRSSKKKYGEWVHPDIVACYFPLKEWKPEVYDLSSIMSDTQIALLSFEIKRKLNFGNLRYSFFQAVSNSSWANEGYLVAAEISDDREFQSTLKRLSNSFGIGIIELDLEDPDATKILYPAEKRDHLDWDTVNTLTMNTDFNDFIKRVKSDVQIREVRKEWYDKVENREALIKKFNK